MKVAHLLPFPGVGGTEIATLRVIRASAKAGWQAVAICFDPTPELCAFFADQSVEVLQLPAPVPSLRHGWSFYSQSRELARELRARAVTLVHCADIAAALQGGLAGHLAGVPVLCHVRNRHDTISRRDQIFFRPVDHFAFVSQNTWDHFGYRVAASRGSVLYDGVTAPPAPADRAGVKELYLREWGLERDAILIGMTARVAPQKDYETLVRAAALVVKEVPAARFVIIGDHSSTEPVRQHFAHISGLLAASGLHEFFHFTGFRSDVPRLLHVLDIFVLSTHFEGFPLAILEAMACAKPVVASAVDGIPEMIEHGVTGYLPARGDAEDLAQCLLALLRDPTLATRMGAAAEQHIRTHFSAEAFERNVGALYARVRPRAAT